MVGEWKLMVFLLDFSILGLEEVKLFEADLYLVFFFHFLAEQALKGISNVLEVIFKALF